MKNKGFTLIELLAVIALIATPIILGIITDARKQANMRSAELYIVAVRQSIARKNLTQEVTNTTCTVQSNGNISCTGVTGELEVQMSGNKATGGTITIVNGEITDVQNLNVNGITYKYDNTRTLVEGTTDEQSVENTGTTSIYRRSSEYLAIGDSIMRYCLISDYSSCDNGEYFNTVEQCEADIYDSSTQHCELVELQYETEATKGNIPVKNNIPVNMYLKHDIEEDIVLASYICIIYTDSETDELVEACVQGGDSSYYGDETTGNVKILKDIQTSFERSNPDGECEFNTSDASCNSQYSFDSFYLSAYSDGSVSGGGSGWQCSIMDDGRSNCD